MENKLDRRQLMRLMASISIGGVILPAAGLTQDTPVQPLTTYIPPGGGDRKHVAAMEVTFKLSGKETGGQLGVWETVMQPGELGAPPHFHTQTDELCRVLEGRVTIMTGDKITEVKAGGWHFRPRNIVHTFWNAGGTAARTIDLSLPAGHYDYMRELAGLFENGRRPLAAEMKALEKKYDITYRYDLLEGITRKYGVHL